LNDKESNLEIESLDLA